MSGAADRPDLVVDKVADEDDRSGDEEPGGDRLLADDREDHCCDETEADQGGPHQSRLRRHGAQPGDERPVWRDVGGVRVPVG